MCLNRSRTVPHSLSPLVPSTHTLPAPFAELQGEQGSSISFPSVLFHSFYEQGGRGEVGMSCRAKGQTGIGSLLQYFSSQSYQ